MNKETQEKQKKAVICFAETENSIGVVKKIQDAASKEGRSANNFLEQLFLKIFG